MLCSHSNLWYRIPYSIDFLKSHSLQVIKQIWTRKECAILGILKIQIRKIRFWNTSCSWFKLLLLFASAWILLADVVITTGTQPIHFPTLTLLYCSNSKAVTENSRRHCKHWKSIKFLFSDPERACELRKDDTNMHRYKCIISRTALISYVAACYLGAQKGKDK